MVYSRIVVAHQDKSHVHIPWSKDFHYSKWNYRHVDFQFCIGYHNNMIGWFPSMCHHKGTLYPNCTWFFRNEFHQAIWKSKEESRFPWCFENHHGGALMMTKKWKCDKTLFKTFKKKLPLVASKLWQVHQNSTYFLTCTTYAIYSKNVLYEF